MRSQRYRRILQKLPITSQPYGGFSLPYRNMRVDTDSARAHLCKEEGHIYSELPFVCANQKSEEIKLKLDSGPALADFGKTHESWWVGLDQLKLVSNAN